MGLTELLILQKQSASDKNVFPEKIELICETLTKTGCQYQSVWQCSIDLFHRSTDSEISPESIT